MLVKKAMASIISIYTLYIKKALSKLARMCATNELDCTADKLFRLRIESY